jgi:hypothetical protein
MAGICDVSEAAHKGRRAATTVTANLIAERLSSTGWEYGQSVRAGEGLSDGARLLVTKGFVPKSLGQQLLSHEHASRTVGSVRVMFIRDAIVGEGIIDYGDGFPRITDD